MPSDTIRNRRNVKAIPHLQQYAPVWLNDEQVTESEDAVAFSTVFQHPAYGWVSRRYRYDAFNDVLYYKGQRIMTEDQALAVQETEPFLDSAQSNLPNSYGG